MPQENDDGSERDEAAELAGVMLPARGRLKRLLEVGGTEPRSVRFPPAIWKKLETRARRKGLSLHAALRDAILEWLRDAA